MGEVTELLARLTLGDEGAKSELYTHLYDELNMLARSQLARSGPITLDASELVHESWLKVAPGSQLGARARQQFFAFAASVMRSVIVDHVRRREADKRGGGAQAVTLSTSLPDEMPAADSVLQLDEALRELARIDERCHRVVEMRYFAGLNHEQIADVLGISEPTVKRDWRRARAFLYDFLSS